MSEPQHLNISANVIRASEALLWVLLQGMRTEVQMARQAALMARQAAVLRRKLQEADASRKRLVRSGPLISSHPPMMPSSCTHYKKQL